MIRIDKYLADMGVASRKEIKQIVRSGRVKRNGVPVTAPEFKVDPEQDIISLDDVPFQYSRFRYFAMDKPTGVLTASTDKKQKTVLDLLPEELKHLDLFPVGRLDKDTSGLLLLTNDGEFAHKVISPRYEIKKKYFAVTEGIPTAQDAEQFREGIVLRDGLHCLPAELELTGENCCFVTVREGKYHQVRRMLAAVGKPVTELRRLSIGALQIENLDFTENVCELSQQMLALVFESK